MGDITEQDRAHGRLVRRLRARKGVVLVLLILSAAAPVLFVRMDEPTGGLNLVKLLAKIGSLSGTVLLLWQMVLGFRKVSARLLPDLIWLIELHKRLGRYAFGLILLHPVFITVYYARKHALNVLALELGEPSDSYVVLGMAALAVLLMLLATSVPLRSRLSFRAWYSLHLWSYAVLPLALLHAWPLGQTLAQTALGHVWPILAAATGGLYLYRLAARLGAGATRFEVVAADRAVSPEAVDIRLRPLGRRIEPEIGQFIYIRRGPGGSAHPYTVSDYDASTGELAITVKALGRTSERLQQVQTGEVFVVDGPYGVFSQEVFLSSRPVIMVAGGVGITAFKRLIDYLERAGQREAYLFYGASREQEILYRADLERLRQVRLIYVLSDQPDYAGETGFITLDLLRKYAGQDLAQYEVLLCGPPAMITKLERDLREAGVPDRQIHHELFGV